MEAAPIYFWFSDDCAWARVAGPGSRFNATALKDFCRQAMARGFYTIVVDLGETPEVDSTFMGVCAFVALRLREVGQGGLRVTNVSAEVLKSFQDLGLDRVFQIEPAE